MKSRQRTQVTQPARGHSGPYAESKGAWLGFRLLYKMAPYFYGTKKTKTPVLDSACSERGGVASLAVYDRAPFPPRLCLAEEPSRLSPEVLHASPNSVMGGG